MAHFPIKLFPEAVLRKVSAPVVDITPEIRHFIKKLISTMNAQPGGIGIAAPQVGRLEQIAIVDLSKKDPKAYRRHIIINPKIIKTKGLKQLREGCMSLPDYTANVSRFEYVEVEYLDPDGIVQRYEAKGLEAVCFQHEVDHLKGMLFLDRVGALKSDVFKRKRYKK